MKTKAYEEEIAILGCLAGRERFALVEISQVNSKMESRPKRSINNC